MSKVICKGFVKVHNKDESGIVNEEIIRTDYLQKIIKLEGSTGTGIRFEWYCPTTHRHRQWNYDYGNTFIRDEVFEKYEKQLTGDFMISKE